MLLKSAGITDVVINTHHLADRIKDRLGDGEKFGVSLHYAYEPTLGGIAAGLKRAHRVIGNEPFVVMNDCVIADLDLADVLAYHEEQGADATLVLRPAHGVRHHGPLDYDAEVPLSALIGEAPDEAGFLSPSGIRVFGPRIFDFIPEGSTRSLADTLALMVQSGCHIEGYVMDGYWGELNTWERYAHILWQVGRGFVPEPPES